MPAKNLLAAAGLAVAIVGLGAGTAVADSGPRQDDLAPHSTDDVWSVINGDTIVSDVVDVNAPVNIPVLGKTGPEQVGNEHSSPQADAPVNDLHKHMTVLQGLPL